MFRHGFALRSVTCATLRLPRENRRVRISLARFPDACERRKRDGAAEKTMQNAIAITENAQCSHREQKNSRAAARCPNKPKFCRMHSAALCFTCCGRRLFGMAKKRSFRVSAVHVSDSVTTTMHVRLGCEPVSQALARCTTIERLECRSLWDTVSRSSVQTGFLPGERCCHDESDKRKIRKNVGVCWCLVPLRLFLATKQRGNWPPCFQLN